jgi:hypothetical protein
MGEDRGIHQTAKSHGDDDGTSIKAGDTWGH